MATTRARGEAAAVADPVDLVEDRHQRIAGTQEVGVQRVDLPAGVVDRARGGHQGLTCDLSTEHALAALVGRPAAEDVDLDGFQIEQLDEIVEGGHGVILAQRHRP